MNEDRIKYYSFIKRIKGAIIAFAAVAVLLAFITTVIIGVSIKVEADDVEFVAALFFVGSVGCLAGLIFQLYAYREAKNIINNGEFGVGHYVSTRTIPQKNRSVYKIRFKYVARGLGAGTHTVENKYCTYSDAEAAMISHSGRFRIIYLGSKAIIVESPWEISKRKQVPDQNEEYKKVYDAMSHMSSIKEMRKLVSEHEIDMSFGTREKIEQQISVLLAKQKTEAQSSKASLLSSKISTENESINMYVYVKSTQPNTSANESAKQQETPVCNSAEPQAMYEKTEPEKAAEFSKPSFGFGSGRFDNLRFDTSFKDSFGKPEYSKNAEDKTDGGE